MSNKEREIKQALASIGFEGLNVSEDCIRKISNKLKEKEKILKVRKVKFNGQ